MPEKLSAAVEMRQIVFPNETQYRFELVSVAAHDRVQETDDIKSMLSRD